jgi:hypothetical protein
MASTTENAPKDGTEDPKLDVFEDDDEFEEFENEGKGGVNISLITGASWEIARSRRWLFGSGFGFVVRKG